MLARREQVRRLAERGGPMVVLLHGTERRLG
jgi:hypothetical protein